MAILSNHLSHGLKPIYSIYTLTLPTNSLSNCRRFTWINNVFNAIFKCNLIATTWAKGWDDDGAYRCTWCACKALLNYQHNFILLIKNKNEKRQQQRAQREQNMNKKLPPAMNAGDVCQPLTKLLIIKM